MACTKYTEIGTKRQVDILSAYKQIPRTQNYHLTLEWNMETWYVTITEGLSQQTVNAVPDQACLAYVRRWSKTNTDRQRVGVKDQETSM